MRASMYMPSSVQADARARDRQSPVAPAPPDAPSGPWRGPIRSLRAALLVMMTLAIAPMMLFASGMAILRARDMDRLPDAAAWLTVSAVPLMVGVAAILTVALAWEAMVMRWLTYLERLSRAYARGRYSLRPRRLQRAPAEFRALGQAVEEMAAAVEHRDQALRDALDEQTVLLREVHHRVKNNLQIVGSLLSLQAARTADPAARHALLAALVRLDAMVLGQRFMREQEDEEQVLSTDLFEAFIRQARARLGAGGRSLEILADIQPRLMPLETGSRLVLLTAEALLYADYASRGSLTFRMALRFEEGAAVLTFSPPLDAAGASPEAQTSLDLIQGYLRQLKARLEPAPAGAEAVVRAPVADVQPAASNDAGPAPSGQGPKFFRILDRTHSEVAS
jgi:hypothetical protein